MQRSIMMRLRELHKKIRHEIDLTRERDGKYFIYIGDADFFKRLRFPCPADENDIAVICEPRRGKNVFWLEAEIALPNFKMLICADDYEYLTSLLPSNVIESVTEMDDDWIYVENNILKDFDSSNVEA